MISKQEKKLEQKFYHQNDLDDDDILGYDCRTQVECICPKCGKKHTMNLHWIGRGVPRKFCKACRTHEGSEL